MSKLGLEALCESRLAACLFSNNGPDIVPASSSTGNCEEDRSIASHDAALQYERLSKGHQFRLLY